jgi:hypothetical protein
VSDMQNSILIGTGIVASVPLIPVGHFLCFGWRARKQQIVARLSDQSIAYYRETFYPKSTFGNNEEFAKEYNLRYGVRLFCFPVLLFATTVIFLSYLSVSWVFSHDWLGAAEGSAKIAIFALAGAYVWVTYDLIIRVRQNDVVTADINRASLRLLLALPFGFAISGLVPANFSAGALAFFVGAFPTDTVLKFMRRTAMVPLKLDGDSTGDNVHQLTAIDGISVPIAERLIDEGINTCLQLAYADPVALTIKSGMDFSFVLDCCGQALVRVYFDGEQMKTVRKFGLRTGVEIKTLNDALVSYDAALDEATKAGTPPPTRDPEQTAAQKQLESFATALGLDQVSTRFILDQIAEDPYTTFGCEVWAPEMPEIADPPTDDLVRRGRLA